MEIELKELAFQIGEKCILQNVNAKMRSGNVYIIKGKSGIGKTTLLNILAGYIKNYSGNVNYSKEPHIEYVFQEELFFESLSVAENLHLKSVALEIQNIEHSKYSNEELLCLVDMDGYEQHKVQNLSGGEKQRIQLIRAFMSEPDLILLDEPTAKLDEDNKYMIIQCIEKLFNNKIVIIVTHEDLEKLFDKSMVFRLEKKGLESD